MFDVANVNLHFGERHILRNATFRVEDGERAAIIGPNGAGKSTLLKIVGGFISSEGGTISLSKDTEIGYLPQDMLLDTPLSVEEECRTVFQDLLEHEQEMRDLEHRMMEVTDHAGDEYAKITERYDHLLHETMRRDLHSMDSTIAKVMSGLGFKPADLKRPCREFSGGWQMRIALGKLLLQNPDILLLDEPTNHLDIESIEWLGEWLSGHEGSVLMVSHERAFMDKLVNKVLDIDRGRVVVYRGNYTDSLVKRADRREQQRREYDNQQQEVSHVQKFIDRFRYQASKAALVQSRIKQLEKIDMLEAPEEDQATINFRFPPAPRSAKEVITAENLSKSFGPKVVFHGVEFTLYRGEKVALVGVNGAGKSTLMKILAGRLDADTGVVKMGGNVEMEYFAQYDFDNLHRDNTVLGEFLSNAPLSVSEQARNILGCFLFRGDDIDKKIAVLSGGERTRLRLARMLCGRANLLLMDEPTNHLDIGSRLTLETALRQYEGAVVLVSHDRYFLNNVVTRVVEIRDGEVRSYPGNYDDYLRMKALQEGIDDAEALQRRNGGPKTPPKPKPSAAEVVATDEKDARRVRQQERQRLTGDVKKMRKRVAELEERVGELDGMVRAIENEMQRPEHASNAGKLSSLTKRLATSRADLEKSETEWTDAQVALEEMENRIHELELLG